VAEYTGQLIGGPDDGNLVTATVEVVPFRCEYVHHLDGLDGPATFCRVVGEYIWDVTSHSFKWKLYGSSAGRIEE
jgi:hypothetical protein